ncbi:MAG: alkaline phosphatase family protein, partial [Planctomycetota bacterium]
AKAKGNKSTTGKPDPGAGKQPKGKVVEENGVRYRIIPGQPYHNMYKAMEIWEYGLTKDEKVGTRALELLEKYKDKPFFFFVHFAEVDHSGHQKGENSDEYNNALISNDIWTGKIIDKVNELGLGDKTQFYITSDHGFNEGAKKHTFAPYVFLATNNKEVNRNGRRQDVAPTILEAFGLDLGKIEPKLDGISLTKTDNREPARIISPKARRANKQKQRASVKRKPDVVYVPTPQDVVDKMLELAQAKKEDLVYDLGCGDGRIVVSAAKNYGCRAVGYDIRAKRVRESKANVEKNNVGHLVTIERKDIFTLDLSEANLVTLYLLPELNVKLVPQLEKLSPGSRIVSHDFDMKGVKPDRVVKFTSAEDNREHKIYLWTVPLKKKAEG